MVTKNDILLYLNARKPLLVAIFSSFIKYLRQERITVSAGHLAFVSLLSLVPVLMVFLMIMSAFPAFAEVRTQFEDFIFNNFVPHAGDIVKQYTGEFVANASGMGAVSIGSLLVVALLLISNIDKTFNHLWRTKDERPFIYTFAIYWMIITLGPLLIGSSIAVSSYLATIAAFADDYTPGLGTAALKMVPSAAAIGAFLILYMVVPNRPVRAKYALFGAMLATILFEFTKKGFAFYVASFPNYQVIYGALASIPLLFLWVYLSWLVVLVGAIFTYTVTITCESFYHSEETEEGIVNDSTNADDPINSAQSSKSSKKMHVVE